MMSETAKKILHMRQPGGPEGAPWLFFVQTNFGWLKPLSPQLFQVFKYVLTADNLMIINDLAEGYLLLILI